MMAQVNDDPVLITMQKCATEIRNGRKYLWRRSSNQIPNVSNVSRKKFENIRTDEHDVTKISVLFVPRLLIRSKAS